jgi:hypothetical protein
VTDKDAAGEPGEARQSEPVAQGGGSTLSQKWQSSRLLRIGTLVLGGLIILAVGFGGGLAAGAGHDGGHRGHSMYSDGRHMQGDQRGGPMGGQGGPRWQGSNNGSPTSPTATSTAPSATSAAPSPTAAPGPTS